MQLFVSFEKIHYNTLQLGSTYSIVITKTLKTSGVPFTLFIAFPNLKKKHFQQRYYLRTLISATTLQNDIVDSKLHLISKHSVPITFAFIFMRTVVPPSSV